MNRYTADLSGERNESIVRIPVYYYVQIPYIIESI